MKKTSPTQTALDETIEIALKDPKQGSLFYDTLLNTDLYFPVVLEGKKGGNWQEIAIHEKFHPLFLKFEKGIAVPCFDTLEKMQNWAEEKPLDFAKVRGFQVLGIIGKDVSILLNAGTQYNYVLTGEILEKLRKSMRPVLPS